MKRIMSSLLIAIAVSGNAQEILHAEQFIYGKGCQVTQMKLDENNNLYVTGFFHGKVNYNAAGHAMEVTSNNTRDIFVAKYDANQQLVWMNQIRQRDKFANTWSFLDVDKDGNVIVGGSFEKGLMIGSGDEEIITTFGKEDIYLLKMSAAGKTVWWKHIGGIHMDAVSAIETDSEGNILVAGQFSGPVDFDPGKEKVLLQCETKNVFVAKYSPMGDLKWVKHIKESGMDEVSKPQISVGSNDHFFLAGQFSGNPDFDPSEGELIVPSGKDQSNICVAEYDSDGNVLWANPLNLKGNSQKATLGGIYFDERGQIYLSGSIEPTGAQMSNSFVACLGQRGNERWTKLLSSEFSNQAKAVCTNEEGDIVLAGNFSGFLNLDNGQQLTANGLDAVLIKLDERGYVKSALQIGGEGAQDFNGIQSRSDGKLLAVGTFNLHVDIATTKRARVYKEEEDSSFPLAILFQ